MTVKSGLGRILGRYKLHPKIRLVAERHSAVASASIGFFVRCGSRHEERRLHGMTHFAEHMFFKGTTQKTAEEISQAVEGRGGDINAFTDREYTCFHAWVPKDELPKSFDLLVEMIFDSTLRKEDFLKEQEVIVQELQGYEQSPDDEFSDGHMEVPWSGTSLGARIAGFAKAVKKLKHHDLLDHIENNFLSSEIVVSVVSPFHPEKVRDLLKKSLGRIENYLWAQSLKKKPGATQGQTPKLPAPFFRRSFLKKFPMDQIQAAYFWPGTSLAHPKEIVYSGLSALVGSGSSSYLFRELRESRGLVYSTYAQHLSFTDAGLFMGYFACERKKFFEAIEASAKVICRVTEGLPPKDVEYLQNMMEGATYMSFEGVNNRMESMGRQELLLGHIISLNEALRELKLMNKKTLDRAAQDLKKLPCFYALGPVNKKDLKTIREIWEGELRGNNSRST